MHPYQQNQWPVGTIDAIDLPTKIKASLMEYVAEDGSVSDELILQGNYILFSGYKVRVTIVQMSPETFIVRLV